MYTKKGKYILKINDRTRRFFSSFSVFTAPVVGIYYNAALFYYSNNLFAKGLSYQKIIGKLFCQYVLYYMTAGEKLGPKIAKK